MRASLAASLKEELLMDFTPSLRGGGLHYFVELLFLPIQYKVARLYKPVKGEISFNPEFGFYFRAYQNIDRNFVDHSICQQISIENTTFTITSDVLYPGSGSQSSHHLITTMLSDNPLEMVDTDLKNVKDAAIQIVQALRVL